MTAASTVGAASFNPDKFFQAWAERHIRSPESDDLRSAIISAFGLPANDRYVYHAIASVTLSQVQEAINHGGEHGMHAWYSDESGEQVSGQS